MNNRNILYYSHNTGKYQLKDNYINILLSFSNKLHTQIIFYLLSICFKIKKNYNYSKYILIAQVVTDSHPLQDHLRVIYMNKTSKYLFVLISLFLLSSANRSIFAADDTTTTTIKNIVVESAGIGSEFEQNVDEISQIITDGDLKTAKQKVLEILEKFQALLTENDIIYVSVSSDSQYDDFIKSHPDEKVRRTSWELQKILFLKAFIAVEENDLEAALSTLESLLKFAPYSSTALCEQGYLYNRLERYEDSLKSYQHAAELAQQFPTEKHNLAIALRGAGYALTKLKKYDQAKKAYTTSLKYDPKNSIAVNGIANIENLAE